MHIQPEQLLHLFQIICIIGGRGQYPTTWLGIPNRQQSQVFSHTADGSGRHIIFFIISQCHICIRIEHIKFHLSNVNQLLTFCMRVQSYTLQIYKKAVYLSPDKPNLKHGSILPYTRLSRRAYQCSRTPRPHGRNRLEWPSYRYQRHKRRR